MCQVVGSHLLCVHTEVHLHTGVFQSAYLVLYPFLPELCMVLFRTVSGARQMADTAAWRDFFDGGRSGVPEHGPAVSFWLITDMVEGQRAAGGRHPLEREVFK